MSKQTKSIKTIVYADDYRVLASIARLHNHRIWEELAIAINEHISKYTITENNPTKFIPETREKTKAEQKEEEIKRKIKIYVETFNIDPMDTTMTTYNKCKKFMEENLYKRELRPNEIDITMFDEVQQERRKDRGVNHPWSFIICQMSYIKSQTKIKCSYIQIISLLYSFGKPFFLHIL